MFRKLLVAAGAASTLLTLANVHPAAAVVPPCGSTVTTSITLTGNMTCPGNGINVGASNVVIDLNGFTITGPGPDVRPAPNQIFAGVRTLQGTSGVVVRNGTIQRFTIGVTTTSTSNGNEITGLALINNGQGVLTQVTADGPSSNNNWIHGNLIDSSSGANGPSVSLNGTGNRFEQNRVSRGRFGGVAVSGNSTWVASNAVEAHGGSGIQLNGDNNVATANSVVQNLGNGINVGGPNAARIFQNNQIVSNRVAQNGGAPNTFPQVNITSANGTVVSGNQVIGIGLAAGITLNPNTTNTTVSGNFATNNTDGILVRSGASGTSVTSNEANQNADDGIDVDAVQTFIASNTARFNGDWGIEAVPGVIDAGGNRASGNQQPARCLNVTCQP